MASLEVLLRPPPSMHAAHTLTGRERETTMAEKPYWLSRPLWQAAFILSGLLLWALYLAFSWIFALPPLAQALLGTALGLSSMASYSNFQTQRSRYRRRTSVNLAQLSFADMLALQRLLPNHEKALSWLPGSSGVELVRWINVGLEKAWPFFKEACSLIVASSGLIKVKLETVFNNYRAGDIEVFSLGKLNLGKFCPFVQGIKVVPSNKDNQCCLEIQLDWRQNEDQEMLLHVSTTGPEFVVQVKNFVVYCVMRLTFAPLAHELPCFGAVVFSIIEPPLVDFQTKFISGDVKKIPGLEKAVDNILLSTLMDLLVWPGRVVVPVLPGDYR
ncbi:hypothetical protein L7F22_044707 [Adiantum nelumboides]|nr:hypothetical protein [Adiantum nelumboides]